MNNLSVFAIPVFLAAIVITALVKKVSVFETFTKGGKNALYNMIEIFPSLIGLIVSIEMLRASGVLEAFSNFLEPVGRILNIPKEIIPLAIMRPVSGGAASAVARSIFENHGPDGLVGKIASVIMGSSETTLYTMGLYYGATHVKNTRYTLFSALCADFTCIVLSCFFTRIFFGNM